ncbi:d0f5a49a-a61f-41ef-9d9c-55741ecd6f3f [Sclerotinia trifoliorum]|uniref:D0f5a49a-a61f-41ef-9d9c-55741ecd6f3f n=1 Tax=Sclerotinia trifoliorum TaxID=28548 RepID=A0A8H2W4K9_9HELO|nr:d0f5a49a-a61f-41ef-9d9c-55741ecd6f3f [Sclerotinia trifoliorum]
MRFSYISALLLAPLALAHPIASSDTLSINQRDGSAPIDARALSVSQKITKVVDEGHKVTEMCQKYHGGMLESIYLYRQFKTCKISVASAEEAAKQSGPLSEGESKEVKVALERLTPEFVQISQALQERKSMIIGTRYQSYFQSELEKLQKNVDGCYGALHEKATSSHQPRIQALKSEADAQFETVRKELSGKSKVRRSLESRSDNDDSEVHAEDFPLPGLSGFPGLSEIPGFSEFPGLSKRQATGKRYTEESIEEACEKGFEYVSTIFHGFFSSSKMGEYEAMLLPLMTGTTVAQVMEMFNLLEELVETQYANYETERAHGVQSKEAVKDLLHGLMGQVTSVSAAKQRLGVPEPKQGSE